MGRRVSDPIFINSIANIVFPSEALSEVRELSPYASWNMIGIFNSEPNQDHCVNTVKHSSLSYNSKRDYPPNKKQCEHRFDTLFFERP